MPDSVMCLCIIIENSSWEQSKHTLWSVQKLAPHQLSGNSMATALGAVRGTREGRGGYCAATENVQNLCKLLNKTTQLWPYRRWR